MGGWALNKGESDGGGSVRLMNDSDSCGTKEEFKIQSVVARGRWGHFLIVRSGRLPGGVDQWPGLEGWRRMARGPARGRPGQS